MPALDTLILRITTPMREDWLEEVLDSLYPRETLVLEWSPEHLTPGVFRLAADLSRKLVVSTPPSMVRRVAGLVKTYGAPNTEVLLVLTPSSNLGEAVESLRMLYEQGVEELSILYAYTSIDEAKRSVEIASQLEVNGLPVRIRVAPRLYKPFDPRVVAEARKLLDRVGLPFGLLYGYAARRAYAGGRAVTLLEPPCPYNCRKLYIDGCTAYKCPLTAPQGQGVPLERAKITDLVRLASAPCSHGGREALPPIRVRVEIECGGVRIPEQVLEVLVVVSMLHSLRAACRTLGLKPSYIASAIKKIEERIGGRLLEGHRGGRGGGYTILTPLGEAIVKRYLEVKKTLGG